MYHISLNCLHHVNLEDRLGQKISHKIASGTKGRKKLPGLISYALFELFLTFIMILFLIGELVAVLGVVVVGLLIYARWHYGKLEKMGIPVVKPHFFLGSTHNLFDIPPAIQDLQWAKEHGGFFGVYEGRDPQIFIADPELIRLITVKDSQYFDDKRRLEFNDRMLNEMPDFLPGEKWKVVRSQSTPAFSSSKIRVMNKPMIEATKDFIDDVKMKIRTSNNNRLEKFPVDDALNTMLTDLVFRSFFSIKIADKYNRDNPYHKMLRDVVMPPILEKWPKVVAWTCETHTFPFMLKVLPGVMLDGYKGQEFRRMFKAVMDERRKSGQKPNDVVDLLIEWQDKLNTPEMKRLNITDDTVMCEAHIFFWVAQDQISTILGTLIFYLGQNTEMEQKLYEEITSVFKSHNGLIEHEHLGELPYLTACLSEAARLNPFFYRAERVCTKSWKNEQFGLEIPKGMTIQIPIWAANRHPDYFEEPDKFIPDRFLPENKDKLHPFALSTFGHGSRSCPGRRFSMECMHLVSAYLLKELKFELRPDSEMKFTNVGPWMFQPHEFIYVDVVERNSLKS